MKKRNLLLILFMMLVLISPDKGFALTTSEFQVCIDGDYVSFTDYTDYPFVDNNQFTQLPFKAIMESMGASVSWDKEKFADVAEIYGIRIEAPMRENHLFINGQRIENTIDFSQYNDTTFISVQMVREYLDCELSFDGATRTIFIDTPALRITDKKTQPDGTFKVTYASGDVYTGGFLDDMRNGHGTVTYANGDIFEGEFADNKRNGPGKMAYANGDVFTGEYLNNKRIHHGVTAYSNGDVLECQYLGGDGVDYGTYTWTNGNVYSGQFVNDIMNGEGKLTFVTGDVYEGQFLDGNMNGIGTFRSVTGDTYTGSFMVNIMKGYGTLTLTNGDVYKGYFDNNMMNGTGVYTFANGDVYEGEFVDNTMKGQGVFTSADGETLIGEFLDGVLVAAPAPPAPPATERNGRKIYATYTSEGGEVCEYLAMTKEERQKAYDMAKEIILDSLKTPATAIFPELDLTVEDYTPGSNKYNLGVYYTHFPSGNYQDSVNVGIYVDAQNLYGALIRTHFSIELSPDLSEVIWVLGD